VLTITPIAAGRGTDYLINSVGRENELVGEIDDAKVAAYFDAATRAGDPAGVWIGTTAQEWGILGEEVDREQLRRLFGSGHHPVSDQRLGKEPRHFRSLAERLSDVAERAERGGWDEERTASELLAVRIGGERIARTGYDCTLTAPKSVSILFGCLDDESLRQIVMNCHEDAVKEAAAWLDKEAFTRTGTDGIRQENARGIAAACFTHRTSRSGDPHLHTHVAVSAKVQTTSGLWRSLDGRALYQRAAEMKNVYEARLMSELQARMGVTWTRREKTGVMELLSCPEDLIECFSKRERMIAQERADQGQPTKGERGYKQADRRIWYRTRERKTEGQTTMTLSERWRKEAGEEITAITHSMIGGWERRDVPLTDAELDRLIRASMRDPGAPVSSLAQALGWAGRFGDSDLARLSAALDAAVPARRVEATLALLQIERSTWSESHAASAAKRVIEAHPRLGWIESEGDHERSVRVDLVAEIEATTKEVLTRCRRLTPQDPTGGKGPVRADGRSVYEHVGRVRYTTDAHLAAEHKVLGMAVAKGAVTFTRDQALVGVAGECAGECAGDRVSLSDHQVNVLSDLLAHDARLRVLVGAAGAGKTTVMRALVEAYRARGLSVIGLAPYQVAANELGEATGMKTMNLSRFLAPVSDAAKSLQEDLRPGTLVVLDEAGTASTAQMRAMCEIATMRGADLLFVGDHEQLPAIGAGGLFSDLAQIEGAQELREVRRFSDQDGVREWEAQASLDLRAGNPEALGAYESHGRILGGEREDLCGQLVERAVQDRLDHKSTVVLVGTEAEAEELSRAIQAALIEAGTVRDDLMVKVRGGQLVGVGDEIQTRRNDHRNRVANRDVWNVAKVHKDLSLSVIAADGRVADLGYDYVTHDVSLAYAGTIHSAQGMTVDIGRVLVDQETSPQALYVALTRGRERNEVYVATDNDGYDPTTSSDPIAILAERMGAGRENAASATTTKSRQEEEDHSLVRLGAVMEDLGRGDAATLGIKTALESVDPVLADALAQSPGYDALVRFAGDLARRGWDVPQAISDAASARDLSDAGSLAAVIHFRLSRRFGEASDLASVAEGLVSPTPATSRDAWCERVFGPAEGEAERAVAHQIGERLGVLAERALEAAPEWIEEIGGQGSAHTSAQTSAIEAVAAYRELSGYVGPDPIGLLPPLGEVTARAAWRVAHDTIRYAALGDAVPSGTAELVVAARRTPRPPLVVDRETRSELTRRVGAGEQVASETTQITSDSVLGAYRLHDAADALSDAERRQAEALIARARADAALLAGTLLGIESSATPSSMPEVWPAP